MSDTSSLERISDKAQHRQKKSSGALDSFFLGKPNQLSFINLGNKRIKLKSAVVRKKSLHHAANNYADYNNYFSNHSQDNQNTQPK